MTQETIKIIVAGPRGRMGSEALQLIARTEHFELAGAIDRKHEGERIKDIEGLTSSDAVIYTDAARCFAEVEADVLIDLTVPETGYTHTKLAIEHGVRPVVGTSGFTDVQLEELHTLSEEKGVGAIIAPNFAIGAVLMMQFAKQAAKYFPTVEIIEKHHDQKLDAPSGTAVKTAQLIQEVREPVKQGHPDEKETHAGARGADFDGMRIHSVRLPGLVAHQEVLFGAPGEQFTVKHDSFNRTSFMSGVQLAVERVMKMNVLAYGLENILD
jgi:4-hydroxy-tetrahydrodipicolinate reductase